MYASEVQPITTEESTELVEVLIEDKEESSISLLDNLQQMRERKANKLRDEVVARWFSLLTREYIQEQLEKSVKNHSAVLIEEIMEDCDLLPNYSTVENIIPPQTESIENYVKRLVGEKQKAVSVSLEKEKKHGVVKLVLYWEREGEQAICEFCGCFCLLCCGAQILLATCH